MTDTQPTVTTIVETLRTGTMTLRDGYAPKRKTIPPRMLTVRRMTLDEIKSAHGRVKFIGLDNTVRELTVTSVKTWVTRPNEVSVGIKYGMYEYGRFETAEALDRLLVVVG